MNHFRPHTVPRPRFEGYYSKFDLPSGSHIVLIISSVPNAETRPYMVSLTYVPSTFPEIPYFQREIWADDIQMLNLKHSVNTERNAITTAAHAFELSVPGVGHMRVYADNTTEYSFTDPKGAFSIYATVPGDSGNRTPWARSAHNNESSESKAQSNSTTKSTPEGLLVNLPLPLHWHVHTLSSKSTYKLTIPEHIYQDLDPKDAVLHSNESYVHQEKNWAYSFPASHIWVQARHRVTGTSPSPQHDSGICIAGGSIIGTESYLISYHARDPANDISFTPPYSSALSLPLPSILSSKSSLTISPTLSTTVSWDTRTFSLEVTTPLTRLRVTATAHPDTFIGLSAPFHDGHRENYLAQSFRAKVEVKLFKAGAMGLGHWRCVEENVFEGASLEFGGEWYGEAGTERKGGVAVK